jgi:acyl-CoA thioesterase-1
MKMGDWLDPVIYFIGSGAAFFVGAAAILLGLGISSVSSGRSLLLARNLAVLIGVVLVAISAAPLPWWLYAILALVTCVWLPLEWLKARARPKALLAARVATLVVWLIALAMELPYHFTPTLPALGNPPLFVIGDSVSAGMRDGEGGTWPKQLAQQHRIDVRDFSKMGATVGSAQKQAARIGVETGLVLLEIGGNDLLGATTPEQFEERLEELLTDVCRRNRTVIMLELPLPPFCNRIGMIQRRLAAKYEVALIPKRIFISVLTTTGATVDGIHLTREGHAQMAEVMWEAIRPAYGRE